MKKSIWIVLGVLILGGIAYFSGLGKSLTTSVLQLPSTITLETNLGDITIQLYPEEAPTLAQNFAELARAGKYDMTIFHRVIEGFMIQGGDYENSNGTGGTSWKGELLADEISPNLSHVPGAVSMANRGPNTNGSQFFIVTEESRFLDGRHSIIGQVTEGMDTVNRISKVPTDLNDKPLQNVTIFKAVVQ